MNEPIRQLPRAMACSAAIAAWGLILGTFSGCGEYGETIPQVEGIEVVLNAENFSAEVLETDGLVIVDFGATWCGPCRQMEPILAYLSEQYEGRVTVGKVDVDESTSLSDEYDIEGLPTFVAFRNGEEVDRRVGSMGYGRLSSWVDGHLSE